jgi:DNA repair ATPase RecN
LKGSGLPNRLRYYESEWKKVREYIEQRERDFSRSNCSLDVYQVLAVIEAMYEEVKADIAANTPDSYVSVNSARNRDSLTNPAARLSAMLPSGIPHGSKLRDLESRYGTTIRDFAEDVRHKIHDIRDVEKGIEKDIENLGEKAKEAEKGLEAHGRKLQNAAHKVQDSADIAAQRLDRLSSGTLPGLSLSLNPQEGSKLEVKPS